MPTDELARWVWQNFEADEQFSSSLGQARMYHQAINSTIIVCYGIGDFQPNVIKGDSDDAAVAWDLVVKDLTVGEQPEEEDYVICDDPAGVLVVPMMEAFPDRDAAATAIKDTMDRDQFWPNVWYQDDHGGFTLVTADVMKTEPAP